MKTIYLAVILTLLAGCSSAPGEPLTAADLKRDALRAQL